MPPEDHPENNQEQPAEQSAEPHGVINVQNDQPSDKPKRFRHLKLDALIFLVVVLNLGMGAASATLLVKRPAKSDKTPTANVITEQSVAPQQNLSSAKDTPATKLEHYVSQPLNLEFDYPIDWYINSDASNKHISISSPITTITDANSGEAGASRVVIELDIKYDPANTYTFFDPTTLTISAASEPITYSNPTKVQRKTTNLSFARMDNTDQSTIDYMFISGNLIYSKGQAMESKNYKAINPFIYIYIDGCPEGHCQAFVQRSISLDTYQTNPTLITAKQIIQSMRFN